MDFAYPGNQGFTPILDRKKIRGVERGGISGGCGIHAAAAKILGALNFLMLLKCLDKLSHMRHKMLRVVQICT